MPQKFPKRRQKCSKIAETDPVNIYKGKPLKTTNLLKLCINFP